MGPLDRIKARARRLGASKTRNRSPRTNSRHPTPPCPGPTSNHGGNTIAILDVAESAAKTIPLVGGVVEGMLGASRKILTAVNSVEVYQDEARELASRAKIMSRSIRNRLDHHPKLGLVGVLEEPVVRVLQVLEDISSATTSLADAEPRYILTNRDRISGQIKTYENVFKDALQELNACFHLDNNAVLLEMSDRLQIVQDKLEPLNATMDDLHRTVSLGITVQVVLFGKAPTCPSR